MKDRNRRSMADYREQFRLNAEKLIREGTAPPTGAGTLGVDALELLYRRASNPEFAADALKLLHELQTLQVEIDLLHNQQQLNDYQVAMELLRYKALYELAPVPFLIVARDGQIVEGNVAAGALFGYEPERLAEYFIDDFLALASCTAIADLLQKMGPSTGSVGCTVELSAGPNTGNRLIVKVGNGAVGDHVLVVLSADTPLNNC